MSSLFCTEQRQRKLGLSRGLPRHECLHDAAPRPWPRSTGPTLARSKTESSVFGARQDYLAPGYATFSYKVCQLPRHTKTAAAMLFLPPSAQDARATDGAWCEVAAAGLGRGHSGLPRGRGPQQGLGSCRQTTVPGNPEHELNMKPHAHVSDSTSSGRSAWSREV